ncbi:hypothetical protein [Asticcacaulis sp. 201]|uniref:hypothetical protein n=1 Tax=Asticcacaulis sp. 201 TaxID=3028787 RepID=UPI002916B7E1|nr:hypothetical protein [Asticcacaulis sp. 201]MDV6330597.1 hypothetical protein [Asticcacaulis sp. 201]
MTNIRFWVPFSVALAVFLPAAAWAQRPQPVLVEPARYGTVRAVEGADLQVAAQRAGCPVKYQPIAGGPCFDKIKLKPAAQGETRVLGLNAPPRGTWVSGIYGRDYAVYDLFPTAEGFQARRIEFTTSDVRVPRDCYALAGEAVEYALHDSVATETQVVSCGGGPRTPNGPFAPDGPPLRSGGADGWHRTETVRAAGPARYLATTGGDCDPQFSLRTAWCAEPAIRYLQTHPDEKELDLIAAQQPVKAGDVLYGKAIDQWVLKRKGDRKFKADARWFDKAYLNSADGCRFAEEVGWYVEDRSDGLYIVEKAVSTCGAPPAPVPTEIWEAYGEDLFLVDCSDRRNWRDGRPRHTSDGKDSPPEAAECFDPARDYLRSQGLRRATVVVLNSRVVVDDRLYDGSYNRYDVAEVTLNSDKSLSARRLDSYLPSDIYMSRCSQMTGGPSQSKGFVVTRSMGIRWATPYRWMECPVY